MKESSCFIFGFVLEKINFSVQETPNHWRQYSVFKYGFQNTLFTQINLKNWEIILSNLLLENELDLQLLKFVSKALIMGNKTGPSEKHPVSRLAQHVALHKAYKPTVSITHNPCAT